MNENKWLKEGKKTKITSNIKDFANSIEGEGFELVENICKQVNSMNARKWPHWKKIPDPIEASANDLLKRKKLYGCIEVGTLFRTLCIARGIPSIFVHTLSKRSLNFKPKRDMLNKLLEFKKKNQKLMDEDFFKNMKVIHKKWIEDTKQKIKLEELMFLLGLIESHVFIDVFVKNKWHTIDPSSEKWLRRHGDYSLKNWGKCEVMGKGLDDFDLGFKNMKEFREEIAKKYNKKYLLI